MHRTTKQKEAILEAFHSMHRPLSIEELFHYAAGKVESINISTIYRTLKVLIGKRVIHKVDIPGEHIRYELVVSSHRHYFICQLCDKVYPLESCPHGLLDMVPPGFLLKGHSVTLSGNCTACISN
jgi:Fur family ferric uptake transcriptional regulator